MEKMMASTTMPDPEALRVTVGVDTHKDAHVAAARDQLGRQIGTKIVATTPAGYKELLSWARDLGVVEAFGVEGTGSYGAGLARFLSTEGATVIEIIRPNRQRRRRNGKSDPADADAAAAAVLSGDASTTPKAGDANIEMIRVLRCARATAIKARTQAICALKSLVVTAPAELRESLRDLSTLRLVATCARYRPGTPTDVTGATKVARSSFARRISALEAELATLDEHLDRIVTETAPELVGAFGIGTGAAGALLVAAGDNPDRLHSEAAFSMLCGSSPVEASSGKVTRHRLNRGGDRQANAALYRIVMTRMAWHAPTKEYVARRITEGKSKREIMRCLKRYIAREVYGLLCTQDIVLAA